MVERFCVQSWQAGGARFNHRSYLSPQPFGDFRCFLRNSRKYGLESLRKTKNGGHSPYKPRSQKRIIDLNPTTNRPTNMKKLAWHLNYYSAGMQKINNAFLHKWISGLRERQTEVINILQFCSKLYIKATSNNIFDNFWATLYMHPICTRLQTA